MLPVRVARSRTALSASTGVAAWVSTVTKSSSPPACVLRPCPHTNDVPPALRSNRTADDTCGCCSLTNADASMTLASVPPTKLSSSDGGASSVRCSGGVASNLSRTASSTSCDGKINTACSRVCPVTVQPKAVDPNPHTCCSSYVGQQGFRDWLPEPGSGNHRVSSATPSCPTWRPRFA